MRILLVEDNLNNQQVASELLRDEGAAVQIAGDGQQAVNALASDSNAFDIVLMDLQMPVMDGYTATRHLREVMGLAALPIVAMTANAMRSDREACLAAGMNDHVGKPFDLDELVRVLLRHGGRGQSQSQPQFQPSLKPQGAAKPSSELSAELKEAARAGSVDLSAALQRMGGKPAIYGRMLRQFCADLTPMQAQLRAMAAQADIPSASRMMHTLRGIAATLGVEPLAAQAGLAEQALLGLDSKTPAPGQAGEMPAMAEAVLQACVEATCTAIVRAQPGLAELLRVMQQTGEIASPPASDGRSLAQLSRQEQQALLQTLGDLLLRLQDSDMEAMQLMSVLQSNYAALLGERLQALDDALGRLEFEAAIPPCRALLQELKEAMP